MNNEDFLKNLEKRADCQIGIRIIVSCLEQIKTYPNFINRREIIMGFIKKKYPKIKEADIIGIASIIYKWTEQYEYPHKGAVYRPSTAFNHPFLFGVGKEDKSKILELITKNEVDYIESISINYSEYF